MAPDDPTPASDHAPANWPIAPAPATAEEIAEAHAFLNIVAPKDRYSKCVRLLCALLGDVEQRRTLA